MTCDLMKTPLVIVFKGGKKKMFGLLEVLERNSVAVKWSERNKPLAGL